MSHTPINARWFNLPGWPYIPKYRSMRVSVPSHVQWWHTHAAYFTDVNVDRWYVSVDDCGRESTIKMERGLRKIWTVKGNIISRSGVFLLLASERQKPNPNTPRILTLASPYYVDTCSSGPCIWCFSARNGGTCKARHKSLFPLLALFH